MPPVSFRFIFLVLISGMVLGHFYLFKVFTRPLKRRRSKLVVALLLFALMLLSARPRFLYDLSPTLRQFGYLWLGTFLFLSLGALAVDGARRAGRLLQRARRRRAAVVQPQAQVDSGRRTFLAASTGLGATALALPTTSYSIWRAFAPPVVERCTIPLPNLPASLDGTTIALLADLHIGPWIGRGFVEELVAQTNALSPSLVAIAGDMVDRPVQELAEEVLPLRELKSRYGTFFVTGNHDYYSGAGPWTRHAREVLGFEVLRNEARLIGTEDQGFDLLGVDDWAGSESTPDDYHTLEKALGGHALSRAAVLLAHQPFGFEVAAKRGIDLQLSGHTHGGQIWPFTLAMRRYFHPYFAGRHRFGDSTLYITRGCGFWGPPMRLGAPPELALITLTRRQGGTT